MDSVYFLLGVFLFAVGIWWFHNPYRYPYMIVRIDIYRRKKVRTEEEIEKILLQKGLTYFDNHRVKVSEWYRKNSIKVGRSLCPNHRRKQFHSACDEKHMYQFYFMRKDRFDYTYSCDFFQLRKLYYQLEQIGLESTRHQYFVKEQRRLMTDSLRKRIMKRDHYTCQMCGRFMPSGEGIEIDHIIPVSKGGKTVPENLQVLCFDCNRSKGAKLL